MLMYSQLVLWNIITAVMINLHVPLIINQPHEMRFYLIQLHHQCYLRKFGGYHYVKCYLISKPTLNELNRLSNKYC